MINVGKHLLCWGFILSLILVGASCSSTDSAAPDFTGKAGEDIDQGQYPVILQKGAALRQKFQINQSEFKVLSTFQNCEQDADCIETNIATCNRGCPCAFDAINLVKRQNFYRFRKYVCYGYSADAMCVCDSSRSGMVPRCINKRCTLRDESGE